MAKYCLGGGGKKGVATHKFGTCLNNPEILGETVFLSTKRSWKQHRYLFGDPYMYSTTPVGMFAQFLGDTGKSLLLGPINFSNIHFEEVLPAFLSSNVPMTGFASLLSKASKLRGCFESWANLRCPAIKGSFTGFVEGNIYRKPSFSPSNIRASCNCSFKPIDWWIP